MKKTLSIITFPVWVAQWEEAKFAGLLSSFPERQSFHEQWLSESGHQSLSPARPSLFFQGVIPILWATTQSLKAWSLDRLGLASVGEMLLDEKRKRRKKKKGEVGTFPSPTHSPMVFVLFSFKSYLKFQPVTVRSARTDLCFNKDAQRPFCWGHGSKTLASGLCSFQCRHAFNPSCSSMPSVFQDKDHFTNLFVQHILQSVTCICNTNSKR